MNVSLEELKSLYQDLDLKMKNSFDRSLPFDEYIFDRFDRAKSLNAGEGSSIHHHCYVYGNVKIGKNCWVGPFTILDGSGGLEIGDNCSISAGVHIYSHDTVNKRLSQSKLGVEKANVKIGHSTYIGPQSLISKGTQLGCFCIVGSNSFVNQNFPDHSVIFGNPAVLRGHVKFDDDGKPRIAWVEKVNLENKISDLELRIQKIEQGLYKNEKI